jgi:hypothetical protein
VARFSLADLYEAIDERRRDEELSWSQVAAEISRCCTVRRPIAASTISGLRTKRAGEGDGILQMLIWLGRSPESFVPGHPSADEDRYRLPSLARGQILRWNTKALHAAVNAKRQALGLTWAETASAIRGFTPGMLTQLSKGGRIGFPRVMRIVRWLDRPAVDFTHVCDW